MIIEDINKIMSAKSEFTCRSNEVISDHCYGVMIIVISLDN